MKEFKRTKWGGNNGFGNICLGHRNLVISTNKIDFGKDPLILEIGWEVLYVGYGVSVRDCEWIECTVVTTRTPITRFLRDHVESWWLITGRTTNKVNCKTWIQKSCIMKLLMHGLCFRLYCICSPSLPAGPFPESRYFPTKSKCFFDLPKAIIKLLMIQLN